MQLLCFVEKPAVKLVSMEMDFDGGRLLRGQEWFNLWECD